MRCPKGLRSMGSSDNRVLKSTVGGDFLATFDECILPHHQEIDQNFYFLIKSPPFACTPPPKGFTLIGALSSFIAKILILNQSIIGIFIFHGMTVKTSNSNNLEWNIF